MSKYLLAPILLLSPALWIAAGPAAGQREKLLFDFEDPAEVSAWSQLLLPDAKDKEPTVRIEQAAEHATAGKHSLKLTFSGGRWPTVTTTRILDDWLPYQTFHADVTVGRPCVVGFTAFQEKSQRGQAWEALVSRWTKTTFLRPGPNHITASVPQPNKNAIHDKWGKVVRFEVFMYRPLTPTPLPSEGRGVGVRGESIYVDNIRLSSRKEAQPPAKVRFTVAGRDWDLLGVSPNGVASAEAVRELGKKLKDRWTPPQVTTVANIEKEFRARYASLKKQHPRAQLSILREGAPGYDPLEPEKLYAGWQDAYFTSHGPDGNYVERAQNRGQAATHEIFMRHRSPLIRVDLASIPTGSNILAARLIIVRTSDKPLGEHNPLKKPTMWVVEPCNRPWKEYEVNAFEYARDKFWKEVGGFHWDDDPDFLPTFLAYGPGQGKVNSWDFTEAVRFWTSGRNRNHGFMLHGDSNDYMIAYSREAPEIENRPAVLVIYEPR